jgi:hypothetical protein
MAKKLATALAIFMLAIGAWGFFLGNELAPSS